MNVSYTVKFIKQWMLLYDNTRAQRRARIIRQQLVIVMVTFSSLKVIISTVTVLYPVIRADCQLRLLVLLMVSPCAIGYFRGVTKKLLT